MYTSQLCDKYGLALSGGQALRGDAWRHRHDHVKWTVVEAFQALLVPIKCEVLHLFTRHVNVAGRAHLNTRRGRQGIIPDFEVKVGNKTVLYDLKTIGLNKTRYMVTLPQSSEPQYAVRRRACQVPRSYKTKAHNVDVQFNNTPQGQTGPMERALNQMGGVNPLVFGAYGEINKEFTELLSTVAESASIRLQAALGVNNQDQAKAVLLWQLRRKLAAAIIKANMDCLQSLMGHIGNFSSYSSELSSKQRQAARRRFFGNSDPSVVSGQFRTYFTTFPRGTGREIYH